MVSKTLRWNLGITLSAMLLGTMTHAQTKVSAAAPAPIIVKVEPTPQEVEAVAEKIATDRQIWGNEPELWMVLFSGLLFGGTMLLWVATWQAAHAAEKASKLTLQLERPYVFVRYPKAGFEQRSINKTDPQTGDVEIEFVSRYGGPLEILFVNFGRSPAILTEIKDSYFRMNGLNVMPAPIDPDKTPGTKQAHGTVTANGDPHGITKHTYFAFGQIRLKPDALTVDSFFFHGYVRYKDVIGNKYTLGYCAKFDPLSDKFLPVGDSRYNYTRIIKHWGFPDLLGLSSQKI